MQKAFTIIFLLLVFGQSHAQYYIRGEVKDPNGQPVQNVKIYLPSTRNIYYSGSSGGFGIPSSNPNDSLIVSKDGYLTQDLFIKTNAYQQIILKLIPPKANSQKNKLISLTEGKSGSLYPMSYYDNESYSNLIENDFVKTSGDYKTSFSMRIDKASYSNIRRFINQNSKVPPDAVRVDEMLNYFNFNYKAPADGDIFHVESQLSDCPWNKERKLLYLNLSAKKLNLEKVPPSNFVFLIDVSGSMDMPNRLPLLKEAFQLLVKNLRSQDTVSIVIYGGSVGIWLQPTGGDEKLKISKSIEELTAAGDTPGEAAIRTAYRLAKSTFMKNGNNRIILATDGDFNIGQTTEKELEEMIAREKQSGVFLTCLGVGMGNYKDSKIEILAKKGNGNFAYIDDIREAEKVLVTEFTQTIYSVASDVSISIKFNPEFVEEYRLIGYDNKRNVLAENSNELEGGEIGSGSGNTVIFEIKPSVKEKQQSGNLPYANILISYRQPKDTTLQTIHYDCVNNYVPFDSLHKSLQFATSVAMFGMKLRESPYFPDLEWTTIEKIAISSMADTYLQKQFAGLIDQSKAIYYDKKKKKRRNNE
ncbi:MAG: von Willebrand factor type A domain-containing protein [Ginsengibacter sp.]